jgi:hypothetical protein
VSHGVSQSCHFLIGGRVGQVCGLGEPSRLVGRMNRPLVVETETKYVGRERLENIASIERTRHPFGLASCRSQPVLYGGTLLFF